ncbi:hypothetical protein FO519_000153 [Halicephalobus sp. NKZ332]|nr:hypothetical protein FO519_000153 [Halicephalobus sp. NKZ332]
MNPQSLLLFFISVVFCIFHASTTSLESSSEEIFLVNRSALNQDLAETCSEAKPCVPGVILPVWEPQNVGKGTMLFRALVYLAVMLYLFLGVSIVSDKFMSAIEVITSQEREVRLKKPTGEPYTVLIRIWNETVSNLTLMALGSSAPEILLSVIEIFGNHFEAGDLGPATIVGSAAFNLFVIIAVCIYVIPNGEVRRVHRIDVFWVTVIWSTFAYIWLYLILAVISPNVVEVWEGIVTFLCFPLTVLSAYAANRYTANFGQRILKTPAASFVRSATPRRFGNSTKSDVTIEKGEEFRVSLMGNRKPKEADMVAMDDHKKRFLEVFRKLRTEHPDLPIHELEKLATERVVKETPKSRAFYRIQATHKMMGSGDLAVKAEKAVRKKSEEVINDLMPEKPKHVTVDYMCLENVGTIQLKVKCDRGSLQVPTKVTVHYKTYPDTAEEDKDFIPAEGHLVFKPSETEKIIEIGIVDNDVFEEDEQFFVRLSDVQAVCFTNEEQKIKAILGPATEATVLIIDDDHGGAFSFETEVYKVSESHGVFVLDVRRHRGARGKVILPYKIIDGLAKNGSDYIGWLCFIVAIFCIGVLTAIIGDVAAMFGCSVGIKDSITAISIVALGTSLPDTFASKVAAVQDSTADAAIGNVTGSNAVNVFLGIGIAWAIAALYHAWNGTVFRVHAGGLASSVTLFLIGSVICFSVLQYRRYNKNIKGELGGPKGPKTIAAGIFVLVWIVYLVFSTLVAYCIIPGF